MTDNCNYKDTEPVVYQVDAAVARPSAPESVDDNIIGLGTVKGVTAAALYQDVRKSGRSTGVTRGHVTVIGTTVNVGVGSGRIIRLSDQIVTTRMADPGDSGSLLLDGANHAIGLLFAGSSSVTLYNPIHQVLAALRVRLTQDSRESDSSLTSQYDSLISLAREKAADLFHFPSVVGVGVGTKIVNEVDTGKPCLTVLVKQKKSRELLSEEELIPGKLDEAATDVVESGYLNTGSVTKWYGSRLDRKIKMRPARPGLSIAHYQVSAGTFGAVVYDINNGEPLILSNNHVLANATNGKDGLAKAGDAILQPGKLDGGNLPGDMIGELLRFYPLHFINNSNI
ncbi:MAG: hypothetical protein KGZ63_13485 [Clostridiales bacterium]|jgi:hypothetical protein|nr:hypothetical protein [Clostridiales bacterium]